jgi:hypothetical protein
MTNRIHKTKLFRWINVGLIICFAVFVYFDLIYLGFALCFTPMGIICLTAVYFDTEPLGLGIGGFDYAMRLLFKEYYNRYFNLTLGLVELIFGIGSIFKLLE